MKKKARFDEFDHPAGGTFTELSISAYRHDNSLAPLPGCYSCFLPVCKCGEDFFSLCAIPPARRELHATETARGLLAYLVKLLSLVLIIP